MKKNNGKQISERKGWIFLEMVRVSLIMLGIIIAVTNAQAQFSPCDYTQYDTVNRISVEFSDPQTNEVIADSYFDILRNGGKSYDVTLYTDFPANTVLKAYLNGTELGQLSRLPSTTFPLWQWYNIVNPPIVRTGDQLTVTKDGLPYLSGTYIRQQWDYEMVGGFIEHSPASYCSQISGYVFLPDSQYPRRLYTSLSDIYATSLITKISLNEPSRQPGIPGTEIAVLTFTSTNLPTADGWYKARVRRTSVNLTESQFTLLRQGLVSVVTYTANHPNGYSEMPLTTQGINSGGDFEGDGAADLAVFRPTEQNWYLQLSSTNQTQTINFGRANDRLVVGDYDSDRKADITNFQTDNPAFPGQGVWQIRKSADNSVRTELWGLPGDIPLAVNIDNNNTSDLGVFRESNGHWYIRKMGDIIKPLVNPENWQDYVIIKWGTAGDKPLVADFNNDRIDELIVFRPSEGNWYIYDTVNNSYKIIHWGINGDIPMAKDFDGDSRADLAVFRPSEGRWYIQNSLDNSITIKQFGLNGDIPVPADFDKDSVADIAVFRPSEGRWYGIGSSNNAFFVNQFGLNGDIPAMAQK
jgi:hypothetical protein